MCQLHPEYQFVYEYFLAAIRACRVCHMHHMRQFHQIWTSSPSKQKHVLPDCLSEPIGAWHSSSFNQLNMWHGQKCGQGATHHSACLTCAALAPTVLLSTSILVHQARLHGRWWFRPWNLFSVSLRMGTGCCHALAPTVSARLRQFPSRCLHAFQAQPDVRPQ